MNTLHVRISATRQVKAGIVAAVARALEGQETPAEAVLNFPTYDEMHRVFAPSRLMIVRTLAGQGALSIREVARRVGRDIQAVHRDVTTLINSGVIDRTETGIVFPFDRIHFDFEVRVAA